MTRQLPLFPDLYEKPSLQAKSFRARLHRFFFGDDIFISYSRADAGRYVTALAAELSESGYLCYFDQLGTDVNRNLPASLKEKIRKSTALVLIGTVGPAGSRYVREEVEIFKGTKRRIIPIDVDGALEQNEWPEIAGLSLIPEAMSRVKKGEPDTGTIKLLKDSCRYWRRNAWLYLSLFAGFSFIALTVIERTANQHAQNATREEQASRATLLAREPGGEFVALSLALLGKGERVLGRENIFAPLEIWEPDRKIAAETRG